MSSPAYQNGYPAAGLKGALAAVTAAVVGVIANLSLWFALHVLFAEVATLQLGPVRLLWPDPASLRLVPAGLAVLAAVLLLARHWPLGAVLAVSAALSVAAQAL